MQRAAYPDGRFEYDFEPWHQLYWDAWNILRYDRHYGSMGGQGPIPYMVLSRYAEDHRIVGDDFWLFRLMLDAIDAEWLRHVAERDKQADHDRKRGR